MDRTLALDETNHLRNRVLRGYRDHHMHVIDHQMPFLDPTLFLLCQLFEHLTKMLAQLPIQCLAPIFRDENHVIFAVPLRVT